MVLVLSIYSTCVPSHNVGNKDCFLLNLSFSLVAHVEMMYSGALWSFRFVFLFKASFILLLSLCSCVICHHIFTSVFDYYSDCEMCSFEWIFLSMASFFFICYPLHLICHCSIQILHPLTRNYGKPWLTNSKMSTPCKPAEFSDYPVSSAEVL